jgi:hypothetical protein
MATSIRAGLGLVLLVGAAVAVSAQAQGQADVERSQGASGWRQVAFVKASNPGEGDQFGASTALSADSQTLAVGAPMESSGATGINGKQADESAYASGAVYVLARAASGWKQQAYVKASNTGAGDQFGNAVALSADGNTLAVAAVYEDSSATGVNGRQDDNSRGESGAVYVFTRSGPTWTQQAYIKASNTGGDEDGDTFGFSLALSGDGNTLAVGAPTEDSNATTINGSQADNSAQSAGAVYIFSRAGGAWSQQAYVKSSTARANALFGYSLAASGTGDTVAVGSYDEDGGKGAIHILGRTGTAWAEQARFQSSNAERGDSVGAATAISDDGAMVAAGSLDEDNLKPGIQPATGGAADQATDTSAGAAYVFTRRSAAWAQQAYIKASNAGNSDWFGVHLALSGDGTVLAVAAPNEDSVAQGIGGREDDNSADEAGAVYVLQRSGPAASAEWAQRAYIKGANTVKFDEFGSAVSLSRDGRVMAVGAHFQNGGAMQSGAVYVFSREL